MRSEASHWKNDVNANNRADGARGALLVMLSAWLGAVIFFSVVVAPAAFRVLPSRTLAGALVGETIPALFIGGAVGGVLTLVVLFGHGAAMPRFRLSALLAAALMVVASLVGQVVIGGRITRLRAEIGGTLDILPAFHPVREEFGRLHGYSVIALGVTLVAAVVLVWLLLRRPERGGNGERGFRSAGAAALLLSFTASCDTSPVLDALQYGIVTVIQTGQDGPFEADALGFFFHAERAPLPDSRDAGVSCTVSPIVTSPPPQPGFTRISAGDSIVMRIDADIMRLRPTAEPRRMAYARVEDDPLTVTAGQNLEVVIPGASGGFPASTGSIAAVEPLTFSEISVPPAGEPLVVEWSPAGVTTTRIRVALRYATVGTTPHEELVCLTPDAGSISIAADLLGGWVAATPDTRSATGRRWRSESTQVGANLLMLYVQLDRPIPVAP